MAIRFKDISFKIIWRNIFLKHFLFVKRKALNLNIEVLPLYQFLVAYSTVKYSNFCPQPRSQPKPEKGRVIEVKIIHYGNIAVKTQEHRKKKSTKK